MQQSFKVETQEELPVLAKKLVEELNFGDVVCFVGPMGAGKTTFIKYLAKELGMKGYVSSPTYGFVNEYKIRGGLIYHFDLYRVESPDELLDMGFEEYLDDKKAINLIEWPDKAGSLIPNECFLVRITPEQEYRLIEWERLS